jgi:hypothetical protein
MAGPHDPAPHFVTVTQPTAPIGITFNRSADDIVDVLPDNAADLLWQLRDRVERAHRQIPDLERRQETNNERLKAQARLERIQRHSTQGGFGLSPEDPRTRQAQWDLDRLTAEAQRLAATHEATSSQWQKAASLLRHIESGVQGRPPGTELVVFDGTLPKLKEPLPDQIAKLRRRITDTKAAIEAVERAPLDARVAKDRMRKQISQLAARGEPSIVQLMQFDGAVGFPTTSTRVNVMNVDKLAIGFAQGDDGLALAVWLHKPALLERLDQMIDAAATPNALTPEDKQRRIADLQAELLSA